MVDNKLSEYQIQSLKDLMQLNESDFSILVKNIEYQLNGLGQLPIDESGSIDISRQQSNYPKEMRELFDEITKSTSKLRSLIARHDVKTDRNLQIGSNCFGLPPNKIDSSGIQHFECIGVLHFLDKLASKTESESQYHATAIRAKSQNVVSKIFHAWTFVCMDKSRDDIKHSNNNLFIKMVSIVAGWDVELARKHVGNFLKNRKESW